MSKPVPVAYQGILVFPQERSGSKIRIRTTNQADAQKAGIPFKELVEGSIATFETWVEESDLVPVND